MTTCGPRRGPRRPPCCSRTSPAGRPALAPPPKRASRSCDGSPPSGRPRSRAALADRPDELARFETTLAPRDRHRLPHRGPQLLDRPDGAGAAARAGDAGRPAARPRGRARPRPATCSSCGATRWRRRWWMGARGRRSCATRRAGIRAPADGHATALRRADPRGHRSARTGSTRRGSNRRSRTSCAGPAHRPGSSVERHG